MIKPRDMFYDCEKGLEYFQVNSLLNDYLAFAAIFWMKWRYEKDERFKIAAEIYYTAAYKITEYSNGKLKQPTYKEWEEYVNSLPLTDEWSR